MLHMWEEPFISGKNGSGAVFFSGCNLGCVYCQNYKISSLCGGEEITARGLHDVFEKLIADGAHNINLVTPSHYIEQISGVLKDKKPSVPVIYNCSGYEGDLSLMDGLCDVYLADMKYGDNSVGEKYSCVTDYVQVCLESLEQMYRQVGDYEIKDGIMQKGLVVRHLVLPNNIENSLDVIDLFAKFAKGRRIKFSLMSQYTPSGRAFEYPEINRPVTQEEYDRVVRYANRRGISDCLIQELSSASSKFVPEFE